MKQHPSQDDIGTFTKLDEDWSRQRANKHLGSLISPVVAICLSRFVTYELFSNDAQWRKQIWAASLDRVFRLMETDVRRIWREQVQSGAQRHFWRDCRTWTCNPIRPNMASMLMSESAFCSSQYYPGQYVTICQRGLVRDHRSPCRDISLEATRIVQRVLASYVTHRKWGWTHQYSFMERSMHHPLNSHFSDCACWASLFEETHQTFICTIYSSHNNFFQHEIIRTMFLLIRT